MRLRNVPAFGLGNHREQSNDEIQKQLNAQSSASAGDDASKRVRDVLKDNQQAKSGQGESHADVPASQSVSNSALSKGIDTALTGAAIVAPATRPAVMAAKAGKEVIETAIDKYREWQRDNKAEAGVNALRDADSAKFFAENDTVDMAEQVLERQARMRMAGGPSPG
jgi:hypothetical protein